MIKQLSPARQMTFFCFKSAQERRLRFSKDRWPIIKRQARSWGVDPSLIASPKWKELETRGNNKKTFAYSYFFRGGDDRIEIQYTGEYNEDRLHSTPCYTIGQHARSRYKSVIGPSWPPDLSRSGIALRNRASHRSSCPSFTCLYLALFMVEWRITFSLLN